MGKIKSLFSLFLTATLNMAFGVTVTIEGPANCTDTYVEVTSPNKNFEGAEKTLVQF